MNTVKPEFCMTSVAVNMERPLHSPERYWPTRNILTRLVSSVVEPVFSAMDSVDQLVTTVVKLPLACIRVLAGTVLKENKYVNAMPTFGRVYSHAKQSGAFAVAALIGPVAGLCKPSWNDRLRSELGIALPAKIAREEEIAKPAASSDSKPSEGHDALANQQAVVDRNEQESEDSMGSNVVMQEMDLAPAVLPESESEGLEEGIVVGQELNMQDPIQYGFDSDEYFSEDSEGTSEQEISDQNAGKGWGHYVGAASEFAFSAASDFLEAL